MGEGETELDRLRRLVLEIQMRAAILHARVEAELRRGDSLVDTSRRLRAESQAVIAFRRRIYRRGR